MNLYQEVIGIIRHMLTHCVNKTFAVKSGGKYNNHSALKQRFPNFRSARNTWQTLLLP